MCACHRHQNIIDVRTQPKQFAHKIDQTNVCRNNNNNSICCHALTPTHTHTHTPRVKKPKKPSTKISLVMKDIKSKSQQLRHEIEASRCKTIPRTTFSRSKVMSNNGCLPSTSPSTACLPATVTVCYPTHFPFALSVSLAQSFYSSCSLCV